MPSKTKEVSFMDKDNKKIRVVKQANTGTTPPPRDCLEALKKVLQNVQGMKGGKAEYVLQVALQTVQGETRQAAAEYVFQGVNALLEVNDLLKAEREETCKRALGIVKNKSE
jgi:hypothetical protein